VTTILFAAVLTVLWVLAWGSVSFANVASGLTLAVALLIATPDEWVWRNRSPVRPLAIARFFGYVLVKAVQSNAAIIAQVVAPRPRVRPGVIAVPLPECSDALVTLISNVMALTPGTMPLEVDREPRTVIYVHVFDLSDPEASRREIVRLADLAYRAFGSDAAIAAFDEVTGS